MHVADGLDRGGAHRRLGSLGRFIDLHVAANLLRQKIAGMRDADTEALLARGLAEALGTTASREDGYVLRQHAFCAARHDECNSGLDFTRSELEMRRQRVTQCSDGVFAGEVIDPAIAFGLAQHRDNGWRRERAALDEGDDAGHVSGPVSWNANHIKRIELHSPAL
jgi:hypothetical protein